MAIVKFIPPFEGIRGTSGTTTFTAGKSGPFIKRWRKPVRRSRALQTYSRAVLSGFAALWRALDQTQRDAWDLYAQQPAQEKFNSLGQSYYASGFNWFTQINRQLTTAARARRDDPPTIGVPSQPGWCTASVYSPEDPGHLSNVTWPDGDFENMDCILFSLLTPGPGILTPKNNFLLLAAVDVGALDLLLIGPYLTTLFGAVAPGHRVFFQLHRQNYQGERSPSRDLYADVVTP